MNGMEMLALIQQANESLDRIEALWTQAMDQVEARR